MGDDHEWTTLSRLLDEALELEPQHREPWLAGLAPELRPFAPRLRALFARAAKIETKDLFNTVPKIGGRDEAGGHERNRDSVSDGDLVGPYRLARKLGAGGMGTVWLAERTDGMLNRQVALKLPHGEWKRSGLIERMIREREILASLNHPNIAHLYDAGLADDGQPYLALEYVEGVRIDDYCKQNDADPVARLRLLLQVAKAVAYAHSKLIVHRDLKPANVLVTASGEVRLLDFGIAKLIEDGRTQETELTQLSGRALTPDYASPEQILGEPLTTVSDVYSLGVLAYEILADTLPYRVKRDSRRALEDAVIRMEPTRPSEAAESAAMRKALRGDVDTILLKALRKDPAERYATADAFAEDIDRLLNGRPVLAQPDKFWYRAKKLVMRNKLAAGAATVALIAILTGSGFSVWQARVAIAERERAEEVKGFIASIFRDADPYVGEAESLRAVDLLRQAQERIAQTFGARPELQVELLNLVAASLTNLQDFASAERAAEQAYAQASTYLGNDHALTRQAQILRVEVYRFQGKTAQMREELDRLVAQLPADAKLPTEDRITVLENQAHLAIDEGRGQDAEEAATEAFDLAMEALGERHPRTVSLSVVRALAYEYSKKPQLALPAAEQAFRLTRSQHERNPSHPRVIDARVVYGRALAGAGRLEESTEQLSTAERDASEVFGASSMMVGFISHELARRHLEAGQIRPALAFSDRSLSIMGEHTEPDSFTYAAALRTHGIALLAARRIDESTSHLRLAATKLQKALGETHEAVQIVRAHYALALALGNDVSAAQRQIDSTLQHVESVSPATRSLISYVRGVVLRMVKDSEGALRVQQESIAAGGDGASSAVERVQALSEIGFNHFERGSYEEAMLAFEEAIALLGELRWPMTPLQAEILLAMGRTAMAAGRPADALAPLEEAAGFWREFDSNNRFANEAALWLRRCHNALVGKTASHSS